MAAEPDVAPESNRGMCHNKPCFNDCCGVFGIYGHPEAAQLTYYGLYALQHRGQESAGITVSSGSELTNYRDMGLVSEVFEPTGLARMQGRAAIGHVRYSTSGSSSIENAQPLLVRTKWGELALGHNGNLTNALGLRRELEDSGSIFRTTIDSEVITHFIATSDAPTVEGAMVESLRRVKGAYSLVLLTPTGLYAARDPLGIRPLVLGRTEDAHVVASETCALDTIGAELVREVEPGEFLMINEEGLHSRSIANDRDEAFCVFEFVYFARPDSNFAGANVHHVRKELGRVLARRYPVEADVVTGVPDSSLSAATGYAEEAGIPYEMGLIKNRYIGRTFIQPSQEARARGVKIKLNPIRQILQGNRVVLVDDSIVRGTTSKHLIKLFREAGATEVHVRISSAPYRHSCYYGIDTPDSDQLLAHGRSVDEVCELIGADSLAYLTVEDMVEATGVADRVGFCSSCFSGDYPVKPEDARQGLEVEERGRGVQ